MKFLFALVAPILIANAPEAASPPANSPKTANVAIETELGTITVALEIERAPLTSANFLRYADEKRFDGTGFYRAMRLAWGTQPNGLIQGGTEMDPMRILPPVAHEPTTQTGLKHLAGTISMARYDPGSATGDFTIMLSDQPFLDADPASADTDAGAGFAAFGHVVAGMDVVRAIFSAPVSPTKGAGVMRGQMLEPKVKILRVRRVASED